MKINRIGLLGFDGVQALDLTGPAEVLAAATVEEDGNESIERRDGITPGCYRKRFNFCSS